MKPVSWATVCALASKLGGVEVATSYGTPALRVGKKFLARLKEDGETMVLRLRDDDLRESLLATEPELFFITDHYRGYPAILIRLGRIGRARLAELLEIAWREQAPKRLLHAERT